MALELLYTSTKTLTVGSIPGFLGYVLPWDAFVLLDIGIISKVFRDGTQAKIGIPPSYDIMLNRSNGSPAWSVGSLHPSFYAADPVTLARTYDQALNPTWQPGAGVAGVYVDDRLDRYLALDTGCLKIYRLSDGALQATIALLPGSAYTGVCHAGPSKVLVYRKTDGAVALVDYVNFVILWASSVTPFVLCAFDSQNSLVVTMQADHKLRLYLTTAAPAVLAAPVLHPVPAQVEQFIGYPVRTRLTGSGGEPCPDYWVSWALAVPVKGSLLKDRSQTDADGYAENFYFGANPGTETLQVEVTV